jgi:hypothetical protein
VGLYRDHPLPRLVERSCQVAAERGWRAATVAGLGGSIVEIGFGSGLNLGYHPDGVELVWVVEPARVAPPHRAPAGRRESRGHRGRIRRAVARARGRELRRRPLPDHAVRHPRRRARLPSCAASCRPGPLPGPRAQDPAGRPGRRRPAEAPRALADAVRRRLPSHAGPSRLIAEAGFEIVELESAMQAGPGPRPGSRGVAVNPAGTGS